MKLGKIRYLAKEFSSTFWPLASTGIGVFLIMLGVGGFNEYQNTCFTSSGLPVPVLMFIVGAFIVGTLFLVHGTWSAQKLVSSSRKRRHDTTQQ